VPIDQIKDLLDDLKSEGKVSRGWIGVGLQDLNSELASQLGTKADSGAVLRSVYAGTPAANAGLQVGDVVLALDGEIITDSDSLVRRIGSRRPGEKVILSLVRKGKKKSITLVLGERPEEDALRTSRFGPGTEQEVVPETEGSTPSLGIRVREASSLGMTDQSGLVVTRVDGDGVAAKALRPGDVLLEANRIELRTAADLKRALTAADGRLMLVVQRRGAQELVVIDLEP